ncbi:MAG: sugar transferase [Verrucomicrobiota bacterium]
MNAAAKLAENSPSPYDSKPTLKAIRKPKLGETKLGQKEKAISENDHVILFGENGFEGAIKELTKIHNTGETKRVILLSPFFKKIGLDETQGSIGDYGQFSFTMRPRRNMGNGWIGRSLDLLFAVPFCLLWLPFHLLLMPFVRKSTAGTGVYESERIGLGEKPFKMFKYRTMRAGTDDDVHRAYLKTLYDDQTKSALDDSEDVLKLTDDPRVTPLGALLRKFSIDEIAQLWNVIKGNMSLIGPRPCIEYELDCMEGWQKNRFKVTPGISGMWQVYGRCVCSIEQSHFLDNLFYFASGPRLYLQLALKTPMKVLSGSGAV